MTATIITNTSNDNNTTNTKIGNSINSSNPSTSVACDDNDIYYSNYHGIMFSLMFLQYMYILWSFRVFGCFCDEGYGGYDCSLHRCPEGEKQREVEGGREGGREGRSEEGSEEGMEEL